MLFRDIVKKTQHDTVSHILTCMSDVEKLNIKTLLLSLVRIRFPKKVPKDIWKIILIHAVNKDNGPDPDRWGKSSAKWFNEFWFKRAGQMKDNPLLVHKLESPAENFVYLARYGSRPYESYFKIACNLSRLTPPPGGTPIEKTFHLDRAYDYCLGLHIPDISCVEKVTTLKYEKKIEEVKLERPTYHRVYTFTKEGRDLYMTADAETDIDYEDPRIAESEMIPFYNLIEDLPAIPYSFTCYTSISFTIKLKEGVENPEEIFDSVYVLGAHIQNKIRGEEMKADKIEINNKWIMKDGHLTSLKEYCSIIVALGSIER